MSLQQPKRNYGLLQIYCYFVFFSQRSDHHFLHCTPQNIGETLERGNSDKTRSSKQAQSFARLATIGRKTKSVDVQYSKHFRL